MEGIAEGPPSGQQLHGYSFLNILYPKSLSFINLKEKIPNICMKVDKKPQMKTKSI